MNRPKFYYVAEPLNGCVARYPLNKNREFESVPDEPGRIKLTCVGWGGYEYGFTTREGAKKWAIAHLNSTVRWANEQKAKLNGTKKPRRTRGT